MTTLIDRIMNKIEIDHTGKWAEDMIAIKKILEGELTAVKGVDELIDFYKKLKKRLFFHPLIGMSNLDRRIEDLQSIKQTPVAEEYPCTECGGNAYEGYIVEEGNCKIAKGERLCKKCMEKRNPDFIEQDERLKDSQPKEVEIDYKRFGKMIRYILTIPMGKTYGYAMPYYILKIKKVPYDKGKRPQGIDR